MRRIAIGAAMTGVAFSGAARGQDQDVTPPARLAPSGVTRPSPLLAPDPSRGASTAPAAVPGDPAASLAIRQDLSFQIRERRREQAVPVPPTLELEVLDPNADPLGNPAVIPSRDAAGRTVIDIPPVVIVFRYYYSGDRSFQGPMLPGGPSILVINHPKTGERLYVETQMLPGAPRVIYTRSTIEFDYGPQSIILKFGHHGKPSVVYRQGTTLADHIRRRSEARHQKIDAFVERTGLPEAGAKVRDGAANAAGATADGVRGVGRVVTAPVSRAVAATPLGAVFNPDPARQAERQRAALARKAEAEAQRLGADIRTVR